MAAYPAVQDPPKRRSPEYPATARDEAEPPVPVAPDTSGQGVPSGHIDLAPPVPPSTPEEPRPQSMAPGLGATSGAPTDADSQAKPAESTAPQVTQKAPDEPTSPEAMGAIPVKPSAEEKPKTEKPETELTPEDLGAIPVKPSTTEQPKTPPKTDQETLRPEDVGAIPVKPAVPAPQPYTAPTIAEDQGSDPQERIAALIAQGKTPGEAKAIVEGREPKTVTGRTPAPKTPPAGLGDEDLIKEIEAEPTRAKPAPTQPQQQKTQVTEDQAYDSLSDSDKVLYSSGTNKVEMFGEKPTPQERAVMDRVKAQIAGTSAPSSTTAPEAPTTAQPSKPSAIAPQVPAKPEVTTSQRPDTSGRDNSGVADFFRKRGDQPITSDKDPRLSTVSVGDQKWRVHSEAAPFFQGFLSELKANGAPVTTTPGGPSGWVYRQKVGAHGISEHAFGGAIDVNQTGRNTVTPEFRKWIADHPGTLQEIEKHWHIYGGERFGDLGHFEWGGVPSHTESPRQKIGENRLFGTSTVFGLNYDGSIDPDDNGRGFFGGVNTRNPKLRAVAVPVDVLEGIFGPFTKKNAQGGYDALDTPEAKAIIAKIRSAHVELPDAQGKMHKFPIVDIQGSLGGHPGKVLDMTYGATKEMGFSDNHAVSYQIIGGDGKPYPIPEIELAGGTEKGGGSHRGAPPAPGEGQPAAEVPTIGGGGARPSEGPRPQPPSVSEGVMGSERRGGEGGSTSLHIGSRDFADAAMVLASLSRGKAAPPSGAPSEEQEPSTAITPYRPPMKMANVLSVKTPPAAPGAQAKLSSPKAALPAPPPAPETDPSVIKGLMKQGFTRQQALAFAAKATVSKQGAAKPPPPAPAEAPVRPAKQIQPPQQIGTTAQQTAQPTRPLPPPLPPPSDLPKEPMPTRAGPVPEAQTVLAPITEEDVSAATPKEAAAQRTRELIQAVKQEKAPAAPEAPSQEPAEFTGAPAGSTRGNPTPPGHEALSEIPKLADQAEQHASILSPDDPRVRKQADGKIKGEHFVEGDPFHDDLLAGLPYGKDGRQRQILGQTEQAIADSSPMHISYISSPKEAEKFPTRESRKIQYDKHTPEARLMGTAEGQLVGHTMIPLTVGVKPSGKGSEPHESYIQGISTNIIANNFQHINDKLETMGRKTPYKELGPKFYNDLEGFFHNLNAGHTATGRGYAIGTADHPNEPDREHVPYKLTRKEADFIGAVINNTAAFAGHDDAKKIRELARANGTLITEKGETNRLLHDIEQQDPGWSGRGSGKRGRVLEPSIRSFKTGLIHEIHPSEEHMPETIRPGKEYQQLTQSIARTSQRGRPDIAIAASLHHTFQDNAAINKIERDFSEDKINEQEARLRLAAIGEDPEDYRFHGGSGGLITPYEDDPEALTPEEHTQMKDNLRKQWVSGKMNVDDYRKKAAEVPLPSKPSKPSAAPKPAQEQVSPEEPDESKPKTPETPAPAPAPASKAPKPKPAPKAPQEALAEPEEVQDIPKKPGTEPIPEGHVRLYHQTDEGNLDTIKREGLQLSKAKGIEGPKAIYASEKGFYGDPDKKHSVEFHVPKEQWEDPYVKAESVPPENVIAAHEPWHAHARYVESHPEVISNILAGQHDKLAESDPKQAKVIDYIKSKHGGGEPAGEPQEPAKANRPPAPDEPLPPVVKKPAKVAPVAPTTAAPKKLPKLVKPKDANGEWKNVPEADKQAYLEEKVKRAMANQIIDKATHKLEVQRDENGGVKYDPNGAPVYVPHDYDIANSPMLKKKALDQIKDADKHEDTLGNLIGPDGKEVIDPETGKPVLKHKHLNLTERRRLSAMHTASAVHTMGDKIFDSYKEAIKNPDIAAGEGWYSRMRKRLGDALGEHHELFAQLLGATSAKTPVRTNFINSLDAFEQYKEGKFDKHIQKYLEAHGKLQEGEGALTQHMRDLGILKPHEADHESDADAIAHWIKHHDILPKSKIGNKYSANSNAVLKVLAGKWLQEVGAPKTPNFAGNLTGRTLEATIDVWAARHLQRLGYEGHGKGPWRAQSAAEPGVSSMDFAFSQDAMRHAADRISRETGKKMNPDDLQAILWFAEKHHYEERGWTRGQGAEKSSFDEVADKVFGKDGKPHDRPMDSGQLRAHYQAEAKALQQRKGKIATAQTYLGTPKEQTHLSAYMQKHGLTHEEIHGAPDEEEEAA